MVNDNNDSHSPSQSEDLNNNSTTTAMVPVLRDDTNTHEQAQSEKQRAMFGWKVTGLVIIGLLALVYTSVDHKIQITPQELARQAEIESFDERLLSCNEVMSAEPTDSFNTCLAAAKEGNPLAQRRMVWAYSRSNQYQDWQAVFDWLKAIRVRDKPTQLLLYTILHFMGKEPAQKKEGEQGINQFVTRNYAPANILMASIYALEENLFPPSNNTLWLLERAYEQNPTSIEPAKLAIVYANGLVGKQSIDKARNLLTSAANVSYPISTNNIAWFLSTIDDNPFTVDSYALELALKVIDNPEHATNPVYLDTLAAAYAANNQFEQAVRTQEQAISFIDHLPISDAVKTRETEEFTRRLASYKAGSPLVKYTLLTDKQTFFKQLKESTVDYLFRNFFIRVTSPLADNEALPTNDT